MEDKIQNTTVKLITDKHSTKGTHWLVMCEVALEDDPGFEVWFETKTKRGSIVNVDDFTYLKDEKKLRFAISTPMHRSYLEVFRGPMIQAVVAQTFVDYCWTLSDGTTPQTIEEVRTKCAEQMHDLTVKLGDLTQVIPSKFADDIVDVLSTMNWGPLNGILQDAILYGPFVFEMEE